MACMQFLLKKKLTVGVEFDIQTLSSGRIMVEISRCFEGMYYLCLQGQRVK
jgi:hypothetical protein